MLLDTAIDFTTHHTESVTGHEPPLAKRTESYSALMDVLSRLRQAIGAASNVDGGIIPSTPHDSPKSASEAQESSQGTGSRRRNMHPNTLAFRDTWLKIRVSAFLRTLG